MDIKDVVHYSDLYFVNFCGETYGINRGVYNTIDSWFYAKGMNNIIERRKNIIRFLECVQIDRCQHNSRVKFGNGGLKIKLNHYLYSKQLYQGRREKDALLCCNPPYDGSREK